MTPSMSGKVREIYDLEDGRLVIVTSDRISAFDVVLPNYIRGKGMVLNKISEFWFDRTMQIIPNHMISTNLEEMPSSFQQPDLSGRTMMVQKLDMLPVECIVRGYLTGSGWKSYQEEGKVCGILLPKGLRNSQKLPEPIFTPTTKATSGHDEPISFEQLEEIVGSEVARQLKDKSIELYTKCASYALKQGIMIADTKFEFGMHPKTGELTLADEVLTPDSSRFWLATDYRVGTSQNSYDKQPVRDYLESSSWNKKTPAPKLPDYIVRQTEGRYRDIYRILTGDAL